MMSVLSASLSRRLYYPNLPREKHDRTPTDLNIGSHKSSQSFHSIAFVCLQQLGRFYLRQVQLLDLYTPNDQPSSFIQT